MGKQQDKNLPILIRVHFSDFSKLIKIDIIIMGINLIGTLDSGAAISLIKNSIVKRLRMDNNINHKNYPSFTAMGHAKNTDKKLRTEISFEHFVRQIDFHVFGTRLLLCVPTQSRIRSTNSDNWTTRTKIITGFDHSYGRENNTKSIVLPMRTTQHPSAPHPKIFQI